MTLERKRLTPEEAAKNALNAIWSVDDREAHQILEGCPEEEIKTIVIDTALEHITCLAEQLDAKGNQDTADTLRAAFIIRALATKAEISKASASSSPSSGTDRRQQGVLRLA
ncbi:MAG: hypothetical protein H6868_09090 [Rhodospirillales bacterium]|nr:hypothetical protein [Rhodospirillales bacterium]